MLSKTVAALILAGVALAQTFSISTPPSIQQCQPAALNWVGGTAPYILAAIPQGQTSAAALLNIADNVSGTSYTWNVNLAQGTAINIRITDATGAIAYSSGLTVQAGSSSGCLTGSASAGASGSAAPTSAVPASSGAPTGAPSASVTSRPPTSSSAPAPSSGAPSSSSGGAASSSGTTSRPSASASGAAQSPSSAANAKVAFNLPVLALAGVGAFVFLGGFAALA